MTSERKTDESEPKGATLSMNVGLVTAKATFGMG